MLVNLQIEIVYSNESQQLKHMKRLLFIIVHAVAFLAGHAQDSIYAVNDVNYAVYTTPSHSTTPSPAMTRLTTDAPSSPVMTPQT